MISSCLVHVCYLYFWELCILFVLRFHGIDPTGHIWPRRSPSVQKCGCVRGHGAPQSRPAWRYINTFNKYSSLEHTKKIFWRMRIKQHWTLIDFHRMNMKDISQNIFLYRLIECSHTCAVSSWVLARSITLVPVLSGYSVSDSQLLVSWQDWTRMQPNQDLLSPSRSSQTHKRRWMTLFEYSIYQSTHPRYRSNLQTIAGKCW